MNCGDRNSEMGTSVEKFRRAWEEFQRAGKKVSETEEALDRHLSTLAKHRQKQVKAFL